MCCVFVILGAFCTLKCALGSFFGPLGADLGAHGLTFEGLRLTLEAHGVTLGAFELQFSSP